VSVRDTAADWKVGVDPQADPALKGKKEKDSSGPSSTQVCKIL